MDIKYQCKECGKACLNYTLLGKHLLEHHKMTYEAYYKKWFKKENEGICKMCGKETPFQGPTNGYAKVCSPECRNRLRMIEAEGQVHEHVCKECGEKISIIGEERKLIINIALHLSKQHGMTNQQYYDKWFKKEGEGICKVCGKPTSFTGLYKGYKELCSNNCKLIKSRENLKEYRRPFEEVYEENLKKKEQRIAEAKKIQEYYKMKYADMNDPSRQGPTLSKAMGALVDNGDRRNLNDRFYTEVDTCDYDMKPKIEWL